MATKLNLGEILFHTPDGQKPDLLEEFLFGEEAAERGDVLLKPAKKGTVTVNVRGKSYKINHAGRRFPRRVAINVLQYYGERGLYRGKDMKTGIRRQRYLGSLPHRQKELDEVGFTDPGDNYLIHVPDKSLDEEMAELDAQAELQESPNEE